MSGWTFFAVQEKEVQEFDRAIIWRLGRVHPKGIKGPGIVRYYKDIDEVQIMSLQEAYFELKNREMLTLDMIAINVDLVVYYKVKVPVRAQICVVDYMKALKLLCTSLFRDAIGRHTFDELRSDRNKVKTRMMVNISLDLESGYDPIKEFKYRLFSLERDHLRNYCLVSLLVPISLRFLFG